jgi:hypothetical protein
MGALFKQKLNHCPPPLTRPNLTLHICDDLLPLTTDVSSKGGLEGSLLNLMHVPKLMAVIFLLDHVPHTGRVWVMAKSPGQLAR